MCRLLMAVAGLSFDEADEEEESSFVGLAPLEGLGALSLGVDFLPAIALGGYGRGALEAGTFKVGVQYCK